MEDANQPMLVILGNQLFPSKFLPAAETTPVYMAEDVGLCTYVKHHQQKIVLFLAAMRAYADELTEAGYKVIYHRLDVDDTRSYEERLAVALDEQHATEIVHFEVEDKAMERRLLSFADDRGLERTELPSPMFLTTRDEFREFADGKSGLRMADFYRSQRRRLDVLVDVDGGPVSGRWSFDEENRKKLPQSVTPPDIGWADASEPVQELIDLVQKHFSDHPGDATQFCWPTTRAEAQHWLKDFVQHRLEQFGPFEDAMSSRSATVFHSVLSPYLNLGLITPDEVVEAAMDRREAVPLQSLEGFVRQLIGWREFVRGVYQEYSERQDDSNFWSHERELTPAWYDGSTGIVPLDDTINAAQQRGWVHHIPRLMVLGNLMTLAEIRPSSAHRWFMEMFVDSSEWVMGPNVYGMGLFSDGGIFATKPYICGSNYLLKMSDYKKAPWCDTVDGLYWRFIDKHRRFFSENPRLALMPKALDRLDGKRRTRIFDAAETFLQEHTNAS